MKAALLRTGSAPARSWTGPSSPRVTLSGRNSVSGVFSGDNKYFGSPIISLRARDSSSGRGVPRAVSDADFMRSENEVSGGSRRLSGAGSHSSPARIPEEEGTEEDCGEGSTVLKRRDSERIDYTGLWREIGVPAEELGFRGGIGTGGGGGLGGGSSSTGNGDRSKIGAYYEEMLKSNPGDFLLLRNYGKFLHEVEKDDVRAEEYYGRAILASPGDGEVLSLYGALIWEKHRDETRAKSYFDQAVHASPDDCMVLGSYAHFMWEAEEDEEAGGEMEMKVGAPLPSPMVAAF